MAIERGRLDDLLLDNAEDWTPHALACILRLLEKTPLARVLVAMRTLKSVFLGGIVEGAQVRARAMVGPVADAKATPSG